VKALLGVDPPAWNALVLETEGGLDGFGDNPMPYGFFDSPDDGSPSYTWW